MTPRVAPRAALTAALAIPLSAASADIVLTPPAGGGVSVTNAAGDTTRFRVADDGSVTIPGVAAAPGPSAGLCVELATGKVGTCSSLGTVTSVGTGFGLTGGPVTSSGTISADTAVLQARVSGSCVAGSSIRAIAADGSVTCHTDANSAGTVTGVGASAPLASSGGTAPNISLTGIVPVANGGTGATTLATNGVLFGQGAGAIATTGVGVAGQVLVGTPSGVPTWSSSLFIGSNLTLLQSTASVGNIMKEGNRFIHNYGSDNTFVGVNAGNFTLTGSVNTGNGYLALSSNTSGSGNTAAGAAALFSNTTGNSNTATGTRALFFNNSSFNTAHGYQALRSNTDGGNNTASGANALFSNTSGINNTATGTNALSSNSTGNYNTATGSAALSANSTGGFNTATGEQALRFNTTGSNNVASGASALYFNTIGIGNIAVGRRSLYNNTEGGDNIGVGYQALFSNTIGDGNTGLGNEALYANSSGNDNTAVGSGALALTTGSNNIAIGKFAGASNTTGSNNIVIGTQGATESGTIRVGEGVHTRAFIAGIRGATTGVANAVAVMIDSSGQLGTINSSRRSKADIADMSEASAGLMKLRPVTFHYRDHANRADRRLQYGLVAEEVAEVYPGLVAHSPDGEVETVMYQYLPSMLLNEYQKQQRTIERQAEQIAELRRVVEELARRR